MKRRKRLEKGISSIEKQIHIHEIKKKDAWEENKIELAGYYEKEISILEENKRKKSEKLKRR